MMTFWIVSGITLIIIVVCMLINNAQYTVLKHLFLISEEVKRTLLLNGETSKARNVSLKDVPKFELWFNECRNYGWINIFGLTSALGLLMSGGLFHRLNIIVILSNVMFLSFNIFFLPKAFRRVNEAIDMNGNYNLLLAAFDNVILNENVKTVDSETLI